MQGQSTQLTLHAWTAGAYFNRGKILGMLGREEEAQVAYKETVEQAAGINPGSFVKALASLKTFDDSTMATMEEAVRFLQLGQGNLIVSLCELCCHVPSVLSSWRQGPGLPQDL